MDSFTGSVARRGADELDPACRRAPHRRRPRRLAYLRDVEEGSGFAPEATILVLNEAHVYVETAGIREDLKGFLFRTSGGRRADGLPYIPGDRHHRAFVEWRHAAVRARDGGAQKRAHDPSSATAPGNGSRARRSHASSCRPARCRASQSYPRSPSNR